jgi:hypothetical protein
MPGVTFHRVWSCSEEKGTEVRRKCIGVNRDSLSLESFKSQRCKVSSGGAF